MVAVRTAALSLAAVATGIDPGLTLSAQVSAWAFSDLSRPSQCRGGVNSCLCFGKSLQMSYVVSANYRDRSSVFRWLVRKADEPIEKAIACKRVKASGVQFRPSNKSEQGFGCARVAFAESVEIIDQEKKTIEVIFDGLFDFIGKVTGTRLTDRTFKALELTENGQIFGELAE